MLSVLVRKYVGNILNFWYGRMIFVIAFSDVDHVSVINPDENVFLTNSWAIVSSAKWFSCADDQCIAYPFRMNGFAVAAIYWLDAVGGASARKKAA